MKHRDCARIASRSAAAAAVAILAAVLCVGCLYTLMPAMAGPSSTSPQPANSAAAQASPTAQATPAS